MPHPKKRNKVLLWILFVFCSTISLVLPFFLFYSMHKDIAASWCDKLVSSNREEKISANWVNKCINNYTTIYTKLGVSNNYYCFPTNSPIFHYRRDTRSPFFRFAGNANGSDVMSTYFPLNKTSKYRIVVIGDSISEGCGVNGNESYGYFLEKKLREGRYDVEILNAAHGGYWLGNYYYLLKEISGSYQFDAVILGLNEHDTNPDWEAIVVNDYLNNITEFPVHSEELSIKRINDICLAEITPNYLGLAPRLHKQASINGFYRQVMRALENIFPRSNYLSIKYEETDYKEYIKKIDSLAKSYDYPIIWVLFPYKIDNYARTLQKELDSGGFSYLDIGRIDPSYVKDGCCINSFPNDYLHPNSNGTRMIADILFDFIVDRN